jgi:hypothetical protein
MVRSPRRVHRRDPALQTPRQGHDDHEHLRQRRARHQQLRQPHPHGRRVEGQRVEAVLRLHLLDRHRARLRLRLLC